MIVHSSFVVLHCVDIEQLTVCPSSVVARWCNGKAFGLAISRSRVQILLEATLRNNLRQVVYTCVSVTKQYNLVPAKWR